MSQTCWQEQHPAGHKGSHCVTVSLSLLLVTHADQPRFERVSYAQRAGFKNRERWHHTDFEEAKRHPEKLGINVGRWFNMHDPEAYVYNNHAKYLNHVINGTPFQNTNIPPGYTYEPWTIGELLKASEEGRQTVDAGDWS